jgi:hypothetical protein
MKESIAYLQVRTLTTLSLAPSVYAIAMFVIVHLQTIFRTHCVGIFVFCFCTSFHTHDANGLLVTAIRPKAEENVRTAAMLLFHIRKHCYFRNSFVYFLDLLL